MGHSTIIDRNKKVYVVKSGFIPLQDTLYVEGDTWKFTRLFSAKNNIFRIKCYWGNTIQPGTSKILEVFDHQKLEWHQIATGEEAGILSDNHNNESDEYHTEYCTELVSAFYNYVDKLYFK